MPSSPHLPQSDNPPPPAAADAPGWEVLELARRSAEAHATFQRLMTEAHLEYLRVTETILTGRLAAQPAGAAPAAPAPAPAPATVPTQPDRQGSLAAPPARPVPEPGGRAVVVPITAAVPGRPVPAAPAGEADVLVRPAPSWVETALSGRPLSGLDAGPVHVVDGGSGLAAAVAAELSERGMAAVVGDGRGPGGVVLLDGMAGPATPGEAIESQLAGLRLARESRRRGVFVIVADTVVRPAGAWLGGLSGLATAGDGERNPVYVECERGDRGPAALAVLIADELTRGGGAQRVRLAADGTRSVGHPAGPEPSAWPGLLLGSEHRIGADSVLLAHDCGAALVDVARETRCRLILLGNTPLNEEPPGLADARDERAILRRFAAGTGGPDGLAGMRARARAVLTVREIRATIEACEAAGARIRYVCADTAEALSAALDRVRADWGPITGLLHGPVLTPAAKSDVAAGAQLTELAAVLAATARDPLDTIVLLSGTTDHPMVGAALDRVAEAEQELRPGCLVRSLTWNSRRTAEARPEHVRPGTVAVSAARYPWIDDHRPQDIAILPPAAGLGWMAAAVRAREPEAVLTGFRVLRPVATAEPQTISITTSGREVSLVNAAGEPCFRARFGAPGRDREWRPTGDPARFPGSSVYAGRPLFHGPLLRTIRSLGEIGPAGVVGTVFGAGPMGWADDDLPVDLAALDGAVQLSGVWAMDEHRPVLPMGVAECRIHRWGRLPGPALCVVADGRRDDLGARCDTALVGPDGELWMELLGIEFVALTADAPALSAPKPASWT
ncbi:polyketide synthase dehydratase domain-containing protein [Actinoplanes sp. NPDC049118]|uniref:polyketide synthase dehydratase domain-containing protein n=1 Tax=Actinoplanes sp. NPDC049118 TaxID=3155769 RepID=UPI0033E11647